MSLNTQKVSYSIPSLRDIITITDRRSPDFLLLAEIPARLPNKSLSQTLRNQGYKINHSPANASSRADILPEVCLSTSMTHHREEGGVAGLQQIDPSYAS